MIDRTTKALVFAIAVGLWMNVASTWLQPVPVRAEAAASQTYLMERFLRSIDGELGRISRGVCSNGKIC